jgi:hypothetical protein
MNETTKEVATNPFAQQVATREASQVEVASARAIAESQAAFAIAQRFPRNENACYEKIIQACRRKDLAEISAYQFSRGGTKIYGPSIHLLRAVAKRWGNLDSGWVEVARKKGESSITAFAIDLESNTRSSISFSVRHQRDTKSGSYELTEERDIYELCANQAARRVRACLEAVIDEDMVNAALSQCEKTLKEGHSEPLMDRAKKMVLKFSDIGVNLAMIEKRLQHKLDAVSEGEILQLGRVYQSIKDGMGKREEFFEMAQTPVKAVVPADDDSNPDLMPQLGQATERGKDTAQNAGSNPATPPNTNHPQEGATPSAPPAAVSTKTKRKPVESEPEPAAAPEASAQTTSTDPIQKPNFTKLTPEEIVGWILDKAIAVNVFEDKLLELARKKSLATPNQNKLEMLGTPKLIQIGQNIDWFLAQAKIDQQS